MSRVGNAPIAIPNNVTVVVQDGEVTVAGPKGSLSQSLVKHVDVEVRDGSVILRRSSEVRQARANHGLMRALLMNMVTGVSSGFTRALEVVGVGYRADVKGRVVVLNLGFSHPIEHPIPSGIEVKVEKNTKIVVSGTDRQVVGQTAANIRAYRCPDHYKGKGVRYEGERIRIKTGKSA